MNRPAVASPGVPSPVRWVQPAQRGIREEEEEQEKEQEEEEERRRRRKNGETS